MAKELMLQATAEIVFAAEGGMIIPDGWEMKETKDGVNYLLKEEKIKSSGTSDTGSH